MYNKQMFTFSGLPIMEETAVVVAVKMAEESTPAKSTLVEM